MNQTSDIANSSLPPELLYNINRITKYNIDYSPFTVQQRIEIMENIMFMEENQEEFKASIPLVHFIQDDIYFRGIWFPTGTILTSNIHLVRHLGYLIQGSALVLTNYEELHKIDAPNMYICSPGTKRLILTLEDCIWCTVHSLKDLTSEERKLAEEDSEYLNNKFTRPGDCLWANNIVAGSLEDNL